MTTEIFTRLTLIAFIFIPLNFATSFFGMNVKQLGTGGTHVGFFILTAALAGGLSVLLSISVKPVERSLLQAREQVALDNYMDLESVQNRDILRRSRWVDRLIGSMIVTDDDGNVLADGPCQFRSVFMSWCTFHVRNFWAAITKIKAPSAQR